MNDEDILEKLSGIVREALDDDTITLTPDTKAEEFADWDSFKHITIVIATEVKFGIKFQTSEIESLKNIGDFVILIRKNLKS